MVTPCFAFQPEGRISKHAKPAPKAMSLLPSEDLDSRLVRYEVLQDVGEPFYLSLVSLITFNFLHRYTLAAVLARDLHTRAALDRRRRKARSKTGWMRRMNSSRSCRTCLRTVQSPAAGRTTTARC